jgi:hypothetical protein
MTQSWCKHVDAPTARGSHQALPNTSGFTPAACLKPRAAGDDPPRVHGDERLCVRGRLTIRSLLARATAATLGALLCATLVVGLVPSSDASAGASSSGVAALTGIASDNFWLASAQGAVWDFGSAGAFGSVSGPLNHPVVAITATKDGQGYWLVASDGGIFSYGDATFYGSTGAIALNKPIVGMAPTPDGKGYWLVASDGGIFSYGDATFYGSTGAIALNKPIVGMAPTPDGKGYWLVASDGGIF